MSVLILSCACGLRMKAKGATPGRVGRCPKCGRTLRVPDLDAGATVEWGYDGMGPSARPAIAPTDPERPLAKKPKRRAEPTPEVAEVARVIEPWWRPDVLFPLRRAEGLAMVVSLGVAFWVLTVLVPELCLAFIADAEKLGTPLMGKFVALIAALPSLMLTPLAITYALQYLGRVLVSGAMGEVNPPRPPDRNADGLFNGLGPWLIWLACGASVGLAPLAIVGFWRGGDDSMNSTLALGLVALGLPYALMALMMTFLHDGGIPRPVGVVGALIRLNVSFLSTCAVVSGLGLIVRVAFGAVLSFRDGHYWTYIVAALACWMLAYWSAMVAMRTLGVFYHHHGSVLRWHREKPWWGVTWGI